MPGIIEFPKLVQDALAQYGDLFANECQRRHFAEYLTGLFVAERKTVLGIHDEFAKTTDQSCLNRYLTDAEWEATDQGQRTLKHCRTKDFHQECFAPAATSPLHRHTVFAGVLLQQRQSEAIQPRKVLA